VAEARAGWVIFCIDDHYFAWPCAPNKAFDKHTGYAPGEKCARRDLISFCCGRGGFSRGEGEGRHRITPDQPCSGLTSRTQAASGGLGERWRRVWSARGAERPHTGPPHGVAQPRSDLTSSPPSPARRGCDRTRPCPPTPRIA
jgi:hypothetical protein